MNAKTIATKDFFHSSPRLIEAVKATSELRDRLLALCAGNYQRGLIWGQENWSGSSLKGAAKKWGARYAESREGLIERIERAGFDASAPLVLNESRRWERRLIVESYGVNYLL